MMIHDLKPIIAWYPKAIGTSVTCYLRFIANPHKETRGFIKSKTKHRIIIQPHQVVGKQNAGKYTKYPPIPSLPLLPFYNHHQHSQIQTESEQNPERRNQRRSPLWASPWIQNHADPGRRHSTLRKPRLSAVLARNTWSHKTTEKWWKMISYDMSMCFLFFVPFWRFTFFNELKYLQKKGRDAGFSP